MDTIFHLVVFAHVVFAILWLGAAAVLELLEWEASHESARDRLVRELSRGEWFAKRVFTPCALGTLLSGILAVAIGRPAFAQLWVIIALVAVVLVSALGAIGIGGSMRRLAALIENGSAREEEVEARRLFIRALSRIDLVILFFILFDMVMRPTDLDPVFFGISALFLIAAIVWLVKGIRSMRLVRA